ncbi:ABC transporter ATP-binding protein [Catellatospora bangladeshensis]|uniref:ABC transporter ATP-binding protein n=1 Tax=Catellatospora bangladeshensis TaxID=310355 RepID=A0A8J3NNJ1_9ACTN|nr:ABC transporter ATP-binding protein [Catellatospora bangladeshensis]GIF84920.1 ABC transporter ATP-binding protein [Catellatospora bangladeshensis]
MGALLDIDRLAVALPGPRGPLPILHDVSLTVGEGELVGIAGESGCGKSMTAQTLLGLLPPGAKVTGSARFDGTELLTLDRKGWQKVRGAGIAMVFQDPTAALHPMLTVGRQLTEHMRVHLGVDRKAARRRAVDLLDQVRIPDPERALEAYPHQFSGGMRQRVAIASALAAQPRLLIADEPTTALDVTVQAGILALLDRLRRDTGLAVAFITHDLGVLSALTARSYVFYAGRVVESGPTGQLLTKPEHPYTAALLGARPHGGQTGVALTPIPGSPPAPGELPPGCAFSPRCAHVRDECRTAVPPLHPAGPGRAAACVIRPELEVAA